MTEPGDGIEALVEAWAGETTVPFDRWVRQVSEAFLATSLDLDATARMLGCTAAELDAALRLATVDDESLALLARHGPPPRTTWFAFATAGPEGVRSGVAALDTLGPAEPASIAVDNAVRMYGVLQPKGRSFLVSIAIRRNAGKTLTDKQAAYALSLLTQLADAGVVRSPSPDEDQETSDAVLGAIGREG
jgi:hypothetical protein